MEECAYAPPASALPPLAGKIPLRAAFLQQRVEEAATAGPREGTRHSVYVGIWSINDNGDVPPKWTIGGPQGVLRMPRGIALDVKNKNMMVSDKRLNAVLTFHFPELF